MKLSFPQNNYLLSTCYLLAAVMPEEIHMHMKQVTEKLGEDSS